MVHDGMFLIMFALLRLWGLGEPVPEVRLVATVPAVYSEYTVGLACAPEYPPGVQEGCPEGFTGAVLFADSGVADNLPLAINAIAHESWHLQHAGRVLPGDDPWDESGATEYACGITAIPQCAVWEQQYRWQDRN